MGNNLVQFIQGNNLSDLENVDINPGSIYFFKDGGITWDYNNQERIALLNGTIIYEINETFNIPKSDANKNGYDQPWIEGQSNWVKLIDFSNDTPKGYAEAILPELGTYMIEISLDAGAIKTASGNDQIIEKNIYSGILSIADLYYRSIDEILLHRAGGCDYDKQNNNSSYKGMNQNHHLYLRLYGSGTTESIKNAIKLQLQIASNGTTTVDKMTVKLKKIF